jgi:hypothetical protein
MWMAEWMADGGWRMAETMFAICHLPSAICHLPSASAICICHRLID